MTIRDRFPSLSVLVGIVVLGAVQALGAAEPAATAARTQSAAPFDHLASELSGGVSFELLAATEGSVVNLDQEVMVSFGKIQLAPRESTPIELGLTPGELLYAEGSALTLVGPDGESMIFGPDEQIVAPELESATGQATYTVANTSRECATLMHVSFGQMGPGTGGYFSPAEEGQSPFYSGPEGCGEEPTSFTIFGTSPSASQLVFIGRMRWQDYFPGNSDDPMRDRFAPQGPVAFVVESGALIVDGGDAPFEMHVSDGWIELESAMPVEVYGLWSADGYAENTVALLVGLVAADQELLRPEPWYCEREGWGNMPLCQEPAG